MAVSLDWKINVTMYMIFQSLAEHRYGVFHVWQVRCGRDKVAQTESRQFHPDSDAGDLLSPARETASSLRERRIAKIHQRQNGVYQIHVHRVRRVREDDAPRRRSQEQSGKEGDYAESCKCSQRACWTSEIFLRWSYSLFLSAIGCNPTRV